MKYPSLPISSFCSTGSGGTPSRANVGDYYGGTIPWVKSGELREDVILDTEEKITELAIKESSAKLVPKGALLIAMYGATIGRIAELGVEGTTNQAICHIVPDEKVADKRYLYYGLLFRVPELIALGAGGAQPNINQQIVRDTQIPLPPLPEQKSIAAILDKADSIRSKRQEAVQLTEELLRSAFLDMFGDPVTNPKGWIVVKLKDTFDLKPQIGTIVPADERGKQLVVRVGELGKVDVALDRCKSVTLSGQELKRFYLSSGDFLLARAIGSADHLGKASIFQETSVPVVFDSHVMRLRFKNNVIHSTFFYEWLKSTGGKALFMRRAGQTAVQFNVNSVQIGEIEIPLPPYLIQMKFVALFEKVRKLYQKTNCTLEGSTQLFNSLLQRAFKGEL